VIDEEAQVKPLHVLRRSLKWPMRARRVLIALPSRRLHPSTPTPRERLTTFNLIGAGKYSRQTHKAENLHVSSLERRACGVCPTIGPQVAVAALKPTLAHMQLMLSPDASQTMIV
jgi:hypothetical protein